MKFEVKANTRLPGDCEATIEYISVWRRYSMTALLVILSIMFLFVLTLPVHAASSRLPSADREQVVAKAKQLISSENASRADLENGIALLTKNLSVYPHEIEIPILLAQANYKLADPSADVKKEWPYYEKTGTYAEKVLELDSNRAEGHYWYGLYLLKKAQKVWGFSAYSLAKEGIRELEKVRRSNPQYDNGGASRVLALLYYTAPGWTPFGDVDKSIKLAEEATKLAPHYALNRLYLANAYKKKGDKEAAIREYRTIQASSTTGPGIQRQALEKLASIEGAS